MAVVCAGMAVYGIWGLIAGEIYFGGSTSRSSAKITGLPSVMFSLLAIFGALAFLSFVESSARKDKERLLRTIAKIGLAFVLVFLALFIVTMVMQAKARGAA